MRISDWSSACALPISGLSSQKFSELSVLLTCHGVGNALVVVLVIVHVVASFVIVRVDIVAISCWWLPLLALFMGHHQILFVSETLEACKGSAHGIPRVDRKSTRLNSSH